MLDLPILVVEDDPQVRRLIRIVLSKHGFRTVEEKMGYVRSQPFKTLVALSAFSLATIPFPVWMAPLSTAW
jgi:DNA-binding response OmpR family regulator